MKENSPQTTKDLRGNDIQGVQNFEIGNTLIV
jgi:hypothetical protein